VQRAQSDDRSLHAGFRSNPLTRQLKGERHHPGQFACGKDDAAGLKRLFQFFGSVAQDPCREDSVSGPQARSSTTACVKVIDASLGASAPFPLARCWRRCPNIRGVCSKRFEDLRPVVLLATKLLDQRWHLAPHEIRQSFALVSREGYRARAFAALAFGDQAPGVIAEIFGLD
jgi:hypothetical protein